MQGSKRMKNDEGLDMHHAVPSEVMQEQATRKSKLSTLRVISLQ